jgi:peptide/nickel transport system substrate-binding protein
VDNLHSDTWFNRLWREVGAAIHSFSIQQQFILGLLALLFAGSLVGLLVYYNEQLLTATPARGGELTEGIIGTPRFVNPLLAVSDADRDLTALVYSGLVRVTPEGDFIPDLAEKFTISDDAKTYTFTLRPELTFHDGEPLTTADIAFTVNQAQDPQVKSVRRAAWEGVTVEVINDREIAFHLQQPYAAFLENLTLGILPKHIWQGLNPDSLSLARENIEPIGSGPFKINSAKLNRDGLPLYYELGAFRHFALGQPRLKQVRLNFYPNEAELVVAYNHGQIDSLAAVNPEILAELEAESEDIMISPLPRVFAVFLNPNESELFTLPEVRRALDEVLDKQAIIDEVLTGFGYVLDGPLPPGALGYQDNPTSTFDPEAATDTLNRNGWKRGTDGVWGKGSRRLSFTLSAPDTPELKAAAESIAKRWREFGVAVELKVFELGDLNQNVIRPRKYQALFFGEVIGRDPDPFAFWHSSQRLDPGLNVALYTSITVDKLLTDARGLSDRSERESKLVAFETEVKADRPAIFVYSPQFIYLIPNRVKGVALPPVVTPADRFATIHEWYLITDRVWPWFAN